MINIRIDKTALKAIAARGRAHVEANANRVFRQQVYRMFEDVLNVSAQFSGDYVSNWRLATSRAELGGYQMWPGKTEKLLAHEGAHKAGDPEAILYARERAARLPFTYKEKVYMLNETPLEFTATTVTGADGVTRKIRAENLIGAGQTIASYIKAKYGGR